MSHSIIRYHALDECFSNWQRQFFIEDLIEECNKALQEQIGEGTSVKRRQVFKDINFMESEKGYSISLERHKFGNRIYYRYSDKGFSIRQSGIKNWEAQQLNDSINILSRFKGLPQFEWLSEMQIRLKQAFKLEANLDELVAFDNNPYLKGLEHFQAAFDSVKNKYAILIKYLPYGSEENLVMQVHPWLLKQYNQRWYLIGFNDQFNDISNIALDRLVEIERAEVEFLPNASIDFDEYFEEVIGVTVSKEVELKKITLKAAASTWKYIDSKPIHGSQKVLSVDSDSTLFQIEVKGNYELKSILSSFQGGVEVVDPQGLRDEMRRVGEQIKNKHL